MRNELMIDIETTGQRPGCKVLSIGAFGFDKEEAFWLNIRKGRDALFERKRKWGKQTAEEKRKSAKESSRRYAERHKNDPKRIEAHRIAANEWYHRHKNDPGFMEKNRKNKLAWLQKKAEKELQS
ncbi:3'-5' exoribonuclease domain-containing protein [Fibrobacter succinogenes]|uniref:3'-5' exoribonuclease domain-containing protein n=1 Tax=Fibrobacter succinogenes TaxID=833 RepID=UPI00156680AE|nr:3'-5' exoribonuclease [Fibrobacter succinogenes]